MRLGKCDDYGYKGGVNASKVACMESTDDGFNRTSTVDVVICWPPVGEVAVGEVAVGDDVTVGEVAAEVGELEETVAVGVTMGEMATGDVARGSRAEATAAVKSLQNCNRVAGLAAS